MNERLSLFDLTTLSFKHDLHDHLHQLSEVKTKLILFSCERDNILQLQLQIKKDSASYLPNGAKDVGVSCLNYRLYRDHYNSSLVWDLV
jgi:hypothetical protein